MPANTAREWAALATTLEGMEREAQRAHHLLYGIGSRELCEAAKAIQKMRLDAEAKAGREYVREVKQELRDEARS